MATPVFLCPELGQATRTLAKALALMDSEAPCNKGLNVAMGVEARLGHALIFVTVAYDASSVMNPTDSRVRPAGDRTSVARGTVPSPLDVQHRCHSTQRAPRTIHGARHARRIAPA